MPWFASFRSPTARGRRAARLAAGAALPPLAARLAASPVGASPENPAADEAAFVAALNATRAAGGLAPLTVDGELRDLAREWAQHQADEGRISHASPISAGVTADWLKLGENVGMGGSVPAIMNAFIKSPGHYANIMDPGFTRVGVGVVWVGNTLFTTHRFMKVAGEEPPGAEPPAPEAQPEPEPAPAPAPAPEAPAPAPAGDAPAPAPRRAPAAATSAPAPVPATPAAPPAPVAPPASPTRVAAVLALLRSVPS